MPAGVGRVREFHATGAPGFSPALRAEPHAVRVQKRPSPVRVRFATQPEMVATREGSVLAGPGDAVLTSGSGEQWPLARAVFLQRYRPAGGPDEYESVPHPSLALPMDETFAVVFADGVSRLSGQPGDWLLDYGDGRLGIVGADIFAATYQRLD